MVSVAEGSPIVTDLAAVARQIADTALRAGPVGRVGLELEAHLVDLDAPGARLAWDRVMSAVTGMGPLPGGSTVTLEPGGQVELSGPPGQDVSAAVTALRTDRAVVADRLAADRLGLAVLGADPLRAPGRISPADRYAAMEAHFTAVGCGSAGRAMMTATASLQVNLEAGPENRWSERVALAHRLGPVLVAVSACSPLLGGRSSGWRSARQQVWGNLDQSRCGPVLRGDDPAGEWAAYALAAPVMLVRDPVTGSADPVRRRASLAEWVAGAADLAGRPPTRSDVDYHLTTLFPPVRPRGYLEIRYLDAAPEPWWPALAGVLATLLDDPAAADRAWAATAAVAGRWDDAARLGLADRELRTAAVHCLSAALDAAPAALRNEMTALAALVERGQSPGDAVMASVADADPEAFLRCAIDLPEVLR